jgi:predicted acylesterase/phospholipase RssA
MRKCDIVMKGGITSGIVYPSMVSVLAKQYQFQSIGGTSAGAIAATVTAAAELARRQGKDVFDEVAQIPGWLGKRMDKGRGSNLLHLFQPQAGMKGLFRFATGFLVAGGWRRVGIWCGVLWLEILVGVLPAAALLYLAAEATGWRLALAVALALVIGIAGVAVTAVAGLLLRVRRLPIHHYGLCTGYTDPAAGGPVSLTGWLDERLNTLAGKPPGEPLTFGDLRSAGVTLRMITTCLTYGRPFTLPFEAGELYYEPEEMRRFFPEAVVRWMEAHPGTLADHHELVDTGTRKPLPDADHLPVVFAARLSLSFPVLFCAVPLYAVDWSRRRRDKTEPAPGARVPGDALAPEEVRHPECVWFSDGGISSNFPMHLFDAPLPRWPTFGVNLREARPDRKAPVWMPTSNRAGIASLWRRLGVTAGLGAAGGLLGAIFDAAQNWTDNLQTFVPGLRDRIVHVYLEPDQGGLNLDMSDDVVATLSDYGKQAARKLIEHFVEGKDGGKPTRMTWDNHRWIRYRSTMAQLEEFLSDFAESSAQPEPGDRTYAALIQRPPHDPQIGYDLTAAQRAGAPGETADVQRLGTAMAGKLMHEGAPKPTPALRVRPTF